MKRVVTAMNASGNSSIASTGEPPQSVQKPGSGGNEVVVSPLWAAARPTPASVAVNRAEEWPLHHECGPGESRWLLMKLRPNHHSPMHATKTLDYDYLVAGALKLILEDGEVDLLPGDSAVLSGVRHAWQAGPQGAEFMVVQIGMDKNA